MVSFCKAGFGRAGQGLSAAGCKGDFRHAAVGLSGCCPLAAQAIEGADERRRGGAHRQARQ
jgi:hypothetical protein